MHPFVNIALKAAYQAGKIIVNSLDNLNKLSSREKYPNDFVTNIDLLVEEEIIKIIKKNYPNHAILGEESGENKPADSDIVWIIDPIDGTNNFMRGFPQFAISIGIEKQGVIEHGIIYDPFKQEAFTATKGQGARLNDRRIRVSNCGKLPRALIATGFSPYLTEHEKAVQYELAMKIGKECSAIRITGSAALDLAYVACGRLDGYFESGLKIWDVAAGSLLVQEAGGFVSDYTGGNKHLQDDSQILAASPKIHQFLQEKINSEI